MRFRTREEAGALLGERLRGQEMVLWAIPGGGVPVADAASRVCGAPWGVLVVKKLRYPWAPETAFGALAPDGETVLREGVERELRREALAEIVAETLSALEALREQLGVREPEVRAKWGFVVDDGMATGYTVEAGVRYLQRIGYRAVGVAVPVAPEDTIFRIREVADRVEVLLPVSSPWIFAVGAYYEDFHQVSVEEVQAYMERARREGRFVD